LLQEYRLTTGDIARTQSIPRHRVEYKGPHWRYCVIRESDEALLSKEHQQREQAEEWLRNYEKRIIG
jgi:hypothetical protein